ncbi:T9SS type A sorting domain-containing protein [Candidatus Kryptobacter tengchongensis]|uniref:Por secretion system C-terminal sorting domain-containing protein n=1 Tax=Kryptobacter tengchongensis TaxID=1643429 RepID=A0A656D395_KRYT1|nr:T9SS type A sorting domain-containing protein [Candidatus Kryptobacter tengchongensis]CUS98464.1 Por secretion system C-terminal sorting domain-containing protein [Candidatus Kryptobacter tengchongensis]
MAKRIIPIVLVFISMLSILNSQVSQVFTVYQREPNLEDFYHARVKYDAQGNIYVLSYDGRRFYTTNNKNGYFAPFKPIARAHTQIPDFNFFTYLADRYDFAVDTSDVIHIAFASFKAGFGYGDSDRVYMFYTNSQVDTVYYLGTTALPVSAYISPYYFQVNVIRTTDAQIVVNFLHYFPFYTVIKWTQLVNPSANNITPKTIQINLPNSANPFAGPSVIPFANKNLFVNLIYRAHDNLYPHDTLYVENFLLKYDINGQGQIISHSTSSTPVLPVEIPLHMADYNDSYKTIAKFQISLTPSGVMPMTSPLDNSIFTLDRDNKLHVLKIGSGYGYYLFQNLPISDLSGYSLYHPIDQSIFPSNLINPTSGVLKYSSIDALNSNDAVILFNYPEYLVRQKQGNFIYKYLIPYSEIKFSGPQQYKALNLVKHDNKPYLFNTARYELLNDSTGVIYLFEIRETNNEFLTEFDTADIKKIYLPGHIGLRPRFSLWIYPIARVDKNNQIHLLIFKVLSHGNTDLGQWYYYKLTSNLQLEGGYSVMPDTIPQGTYIDFDIDDNGIAHVVYVKYENNTGIIYYTNNSSGTFAPPINTGGTLSISGTNWVRIKSTNNGNVYIIYLNYVSGVNFVYGNLNGFSNPKGLSSISENLDIGGGRTDIAFEVDKNGNMHCFEKSYWLNYSKDLLSYKYKLVRDSVISIPTSAGLYTNLDSPQFVSILRDRDRNIHVLGITKTQKIYHINSLDNFQSVRTYNLSDFGITNFTRQGEIFWDHFKPFAYEDLKRIYFIAGEALRYYLIGWIPDAITGVKKDENITPSKFALYQNYPNPFNPATKIEFEIPQKEHVKLRIYDILGREVMKVFEDEISAGRYSISVDMSGYPSGVYFYRLEAGKFVSVKKMMLIK